MPPEQIHETREYENREKDDDGAKTQQATHIVWIAGKHRYGVRCYTNNKIFH